MSQIIHLVASYLVGNLNPLSKPQSILSVRFIANLGSFFFLVFGYVLGCRALYHYLLPQLGEVYTLLGLGGFLVATSLLLFIIGWFLKPKEPPIREFIANVEKALSDLPHNEIVKKITDHVNPKTLVGLFAIVVVTSYLTKSKKII
jgi:hypothetical protein